MRVVCSKSVTATHENALGDLSRTKGGAMDKLSRLVEGYDGFALSRSYKHAS